MTIGGFGTVANMNKFISRVKLQNRDYNKKQLRPACSLTTAIHEIKTISSTIVIHR